MSRVPASVRYQCDRETRGRFGLRNPLRTDRTKGCCSFLRESASLTLLALLLHGGVSEQDCPFLGLISEPAVVAFAGMPAAITNGHIALKLLMVCVPFRGKKIQRFQQLLVGRSEEH